MSGIRFRRGIHARGRMQLGHQLRRRAGVATILKGVWCRFIILLSNDPMCINVMNMKNTHLYVGTMLNGVSTDCMGQSL
jgi:hypothetical protein